jgi:hypothetical protein
VTKQDAQKVWRMKAAHKPLRSLPDAAVFLWLLEQETKSLMKLVKAMEKAA